MNPASIRQAICDTFHDFPCAANARFMGCGQNNNLTVMSSMVIKLGGLQEQEVYMRARCVFVPYSNCKCYMLKGAVLWATKGNIIITRKAQVF